MRKSRPIIERPESMAKQEERLQNRHLMLKSRVQAMEDRPHLASRDQTEFVQMKKEKLAIKDALRELKKYG